MITYQDGFKYRLAVDWEGWQLPPEFIVMKPEKNKYWELTKTGFIRAFEGCCWDGPTWYPDRKWMMEPSLCHDILHWCIAKGCIPEYQNDMIDRELEQVALARSPIPFGGLGWLKIKARVIRRATNLVNEHEGTVKKSITIKRKDQ